MLVTSTDTPGIALPRMPYCGHIQTAPFPKTISASAGDRRTVIDSVRSIIRETWETVSTSKAHFQANGIKYKEGNTFFH
jgi:hypothetical protein